MTKTDPKPTQIDHPHDLDKVSTPKRGGVLRGGGGFAAVFKVSNLIRFEIVAIPICNLGI